MQPDLAGDDPADAFNEALGLVLFLTATDDLVDGRTWRNAERRLVDDLIAGVSSGTMKWQERRRSTSAHSRRERRDRAASP